MPCLISRSGATKLKANHYGIEVANSVTWNGWEPGYEYKKDIVLKNVNIKTQKIKYRVPSSRFFTTIYPETIVLSAGTSFTLPVTFHPLEKNIYEDKIEFSTKDGVFTIPIRALLPKHQIIVPQHINFHMCATHDVVQLSFTIENTSELDTPYKIECLEPFFIDAIEGVLEPYSSCVRIISFKPKAALVYQGNIVISYGESYKLSKMTKLEGIGKYPHLLVNCGDNSEVLKFGDVPINKTVEKWMLLQNLAPVNTPFTIDHPNSSSIDSVFQCLMMEGIVPAHGALKIPFMYYPISVGVRSIDDFHIKAIGNMSRTSLKCTGYSTGPQVHLSQTLLNFNQINAGESSGRVIDIVNDSNCDAAYQFVIDSQESVFVFEKTSGVLATKSKLTLRVQFHPNHAINYYRRVTCLVHNQMPLYIDLLGTCHSETQKPAVLQAQHVHRYFTHVDRGLSYTAPEHLNDKLKAGVVLQCDDGTLYNKPSGEDGSAPPPSPVKLGHYTMEDYFNDGYYSDVVRYSPHVSTDAHEISFGRCTDERVIEQRTVNVTNHTKGKITVVWNGGDTHAFSIHPREADIPPLKSYSFRISFKPKSENQFYGAELEGYAYYKSLRDYRLVEERTHCPSWCLTVVTTGHTFNEYNETFIANCHMDNTKIVFPAVNTNESGFQTCLLSNTGTTPIVYDFDNKKSSTFTMKPTKGILRAGCEQIFVIRAKPSEIHTYKEMLDLKMNDDEKNTQEISVICSAEVARVKLEDGAEIFFKPTCMGTVSSRTYNVKNTSRIALEYEWKLHHPDGDVLSVERPCGVIQPNETQKHMWNFKPSEMRKYVLKPCLIVWGKGLSQSCSAGKKQQFKLRAIGEGCQGKIQSDKEYLDFGTVIVGNSSYKHLVLTNDSECSMHYKLHLNQSISSPYDDRVISDLPLALVFDQMEGVIPARSKQLILATFKPKCRVCYQCVVTYELLNADEESTTPSSSHLCHVIGSGVFPALTVTDARCYGSALNISKKQLWHLFSLDDLNVCFDSDPSPDEMKYSMATRQGHQKKPEIYTRAILDFNFGAAPVGSEPCVVQLMLENSGTVSADWAFMFPPDLQLELEYWAESGEFTEEELHHMKVVDNKLFRVEPKSGRLAAGQSTDVTFIYHHDMAGTDRLPVLLKLAQGREILTPACEQSVRYTSLNFIGVTVDPSRKYIHFPSNKHQFSPVPIGEKASPTQVYELYNGGALPVKYEIDVRPLDQLTNANYEHPVFECLEPIGEVLPGQTASVPWRFSPLEACTYAVDVPIHIHGGDIAVVTMTGVGYDSRALGATMPLTDGHGMTGVPPIQSITVAGQLCYLSEERLSLGNIPQLSRARRMLVFTNRSQEHDVSFVWHVTSKVNTKLITISPRHGELAAGESCMCRVTFLALGDPSFFDLDLVCEVTNMTDYRSYLAKLENWEAERLRQQVEFTITEENVDDGDVSLPSTAGRPRSGQLQALSETASPTRDSETHLAKYKTLPPIRQPTMESRRYMEKAQRKFENFYWERPTAPQPFLLHLGVTARTHDVWEYQQLFGDQYNNYIIDRLLGKQDYETPAEHVINSDEDKYVCLEAEQHIVAGVMSNIIRGLLDDAQFHDCIQCLDDEPIPYFQQYSTKEPTPRPTVPMIDLPEQTPTGRLPQDDDHHISELPTPNEQGTDHKPSAISRQASMDSGPASASQMQHSNHDISQPPTPTVHNNTAGHTPAPSVHGSVNSRRSRSISASAAGSAAGSAVGSAVGSAAGSAHHADGSQHSQATIHEDASLPTSPVMENLDIDISQENMLEFQKQEQIIKKSPEFTSLLEGVLENTLMNVVEEAFNEEYNITARPRLVALLPRPKSGDRVSPPVSR